MVCPKVALNTAAGDFGYFAAPEAFVALTLTEAAVDLVVSTAFGSDAAGSGVHRNALTLKGGT